MYLEDAVKGIKIISKGNPPKTNEYEAYALVRGYKRVLRRIRIKIRPPSTLSDIAINLIEFELGYNRDRYTFYTSDEDIGL